MVTQEDIEKLGLSRLGLYFAYYKGNEKPLTVMIGNLNGKTWINLNQSHFMPTYNLDYFLEGLEKIEIKK
mgnify:CR=1 FL=1